MRKLALLCGAQETGQPVNFDAYAKDPAKFWEDLEVCRLPRDATLCRRAWKMLILMPSMAAPSATELAEQERTHERACQSLPETVQRCLTAYGVRHTEACEASKAREKLREATRAVEEQERTACACFDWVHLADHGRTCWASLSECQTKRAEAFPPGRGSAMECELSRCPEAGAKGD